MPSVATDVVSLGSSDLLNGFEASSSSYSSSTETDTDPVLPAINEVNKAAAVLKRSPPPPPPPPPAKKVNTGPRESILYGDRSLYYTVPDNERRPVVLFPLPPEQQLPINIDPISSDSSTETDNEQPPPPGTKGFGYYGGSEPPAKKRRQQQQQQQQPPPSGIIPGAVQAAQAARAATYLMENAVRKKRRDAYQPPRYLIYPYNSFTNFLATAGRDGSHK